MFYTKNNKLFFCLSLFLILFQGLIPTCAKEINSEIFNELNNASEPIRPIFGKVSESIKGGVALYRYVPQTIYPTKKEETTTETLSLLPTKNNSISDLEIKRDELKQSELEGINFIQPSLDLTDTEQKAIDEFFSRNEQEQLTNLWQSTIERNKTIQFIIQKLAPPDSPQEARSTLSKTIGAAIFLPFYAIQAFANNSGAQFGSDIGGRVLGSVIQGKMQKNKTQMQLSQTESIVLFMLIDDVAERLRQRYHSYKKALIERTLATNELEEAKGDSLDALAASDNSSQILTNIQRRAIEREIRKLDAEVRYFKNSLIELAGFESVNELDNQLKIELAASTNTPLDFTGLKTHE